MKKFLLIFLFLSFNSNSQNLSKVDQIIKSYPYIGSIENLAKKIDYDFLTKIEKARAVYSWLTININYYSDNILKPSELIIYYNEYDLKRRRINIEKRRKEKIINDMISLRRGNCEGYALVFNKICELLKLESYIIKGYVKTNANEIEYLAKEKNHAWNAIKINNNWIFLDATFGSERLNGIVNNSKHEKYYFNIKKEELIKTHYPSDKIWIKIMGQNPLIDFCDKPIFNKSFFIQKAKLISHKKGKIIIKKREKIRLKLKGLKPKTKILYSYNLDQNSKKPNIKIKKGITEMVIKAPKKNSFLTIFFDEEQALQYKVVVR